MNKIAVMELDTNYIGLVLAHCNDSGQFSIYDRRLERIRIDSDFAQGGNFKPIRVDDAVRLVSYYKKVIASEHVDTVLCFCTQRFGSLKMYKAITEEIFSLTGYDFADYNDSYANLIHHCNFNTMEPVKAYVINIESNNINFIRYNRKNITDALTFDFGAETLAKLFEDEVCSPREKMEKMIAYCKDQFEGCSFFDMDDDDYKKIGMGKTFTNISKICRLGTKYSYNRDHNYELTEDNFNNALRIIQDLDADKTKKIKGISSDRADIVASGTAIIKAMYDCFYFDNIKINATEIYEGVIYDYMSKLCGDKLYPDVLTSSLETCNYFHGEDVEECARIYSIANDLFDELRVLHRYTKHQNKILKIASYFANSGKRLSYYNFERNSLLVTHNSDIKGASHLEILVAGFVAGSQNLDEFDINKWVVHRDIIDESYMDVVKKLAVLVKIARIIVKICPAMHAVCDVLGDNCILSVTSSDGEVYNTNEIKTAVNDFKKAYNKILQVL